MTVRILVVTRIPVSVDIDPDRPLGYDWPRRFSISPMKLLLFRRLFLATLVAVTSVVVIGCSSKTTIAPNWYDSSFNKGGAVPADDNLPTASTAEPGNR